jgi:hypothetical protein
MRTFLTGLVGARSGLLLAALMMVVTATGCGSSEIKSTSQPIDSTGTPTASDTVAAFTQATQTASPAPTKTPSPTPVGSKVEISNAHAYATSYGSAYVVGEIQNTGDKDAGNINLAASLVDGAGNVIGSGSDSVNILTVLAPGEKAPYKIGILNAPAQWADSKVQVQWRDASSIDRAFAYTRNLTVSGLSETQGQFGDVSIHGQVANSSGKAVSIIELYFVGRDGTGAVTFVDEGFADLSSLPPGGTSPFTIDIFSMPDPAPSKYQVIAQASPQ